MFPKQTGAAGRGDWRFGDLPGPQTYGHWGATGTALWIDPQADAFAVIFTTQPQEPHGRFLSRLSNLLAASLQ